MMASVAADSTLPKGDTIFDIICIGAATIVAAV
jgi:hypothetical protein